MELSAMARAAELSLNEKWISSAKVILTGFAVVFAMLFLLIIIIKIYSTVVTKIQDANTVKARKKEKLGKSLELVSKKDEPPVFTPAAEDGVSEEIVAVIAAAVASMYGEKGRVRIKSIKKSGARSAWANAGVLENTRPF